MRKGHPLVDKAVGSVSPLSAGRSSLHHSQCLSWRRDWGPKEAHMCCPTRAETVSKIGRVPRLESKSSVALITQLWSPYGSYRASVTKYHKLGNLEQQKFIASQFWRPEVQSQGMSRAILPWKVLARIWLVLGFSTWLIDDCFLPVPLLLLIPLWVSVSVSIPLFYKDTIHVRSGPILKASLELDGFYRGPVSR